jgi:hypothetical protein
MFILNQSIDDIPIERFECIYSLAKRRGPVPGKTNPSIPSTSQSQRRSSLDMADMVDDSSDGEHQHQSQRSPSPEHNSRIRSSSLQHGMSPGKSGAMILPRGGRMGVGATTTATSGVAGRIDGSDLLNDAHLTAALLQHAQQNYQQQQQFHNLHQQDIVFDKSQQPSSASLQHHLSILQQMQQQERQFQNQQDKRLSLGVINNTESSRLKDNADTANRRRKSVGDGVSPSPLIMESSLSQQQESGATVKSSTLPVAAAAAGSSLSLPGDIGGAPGLGNVAAAVATITNRRNNDTSTTTGSSSSYGIVAGVPRTVRLHTHLLDRNDVDGERLRSYYRLSIDEMFCLPVSPTDEEYCSRSNVVGLTPNMIPGTHLAALSAVRFAEAALGAIVNNEIPLGTELCNAVVHCLRESVQDPIQTPVLFEVAKSYFLLSVFRAFRGDMVRYFKYRRVCLNYIAKLPVS